MRKLFIALALLMGLSSAASAQLDEVRTVGLEPGLSITLRIDPAGKVSFAPDGEARLSDMDKAALRDMGLRYENPEQLAQSSGPNAAIMQLDEGEPEPIEPGVVRVSFFSVTGRDGSAQTLLVIENGYDRAFRYRARMVNDKDSEPTDVCTVLPRLRGYEHWPYPIERLDLTGFALVRHRDGQRPVCE